MITLLIILSVVFQTLSPNSGLSYDGVKSICQDRSGFMWLTLREDVYRYDGYTYVSYANRVSGNVGNLFFRQIRSENDSLYLSTSNGEYVYDEQCDSFFLAVNRHKPSLLMDDERFGLPFTKVVMPDLNHRVWVGTPTGLVVIDSVTNRREEYLSSNSALASSSVWSLYRDHLGYMWVGTYAGGVHLATYADEQPINVFCLCECGLSKHAVSSFAWDGQYMWIGTEGGGLLQLQPVRNKFRVKAHFTTRNSGLSSNSVNSLLVQDGRLWIGSYMGGLDCMTLSNHTFKHIDMRKIYRYDLPDHIKKLVPDGDNGMWILSQRTKYQLLYYSFRNGQHYAVQVSSDAKEYEYGTFVDGVMKNGVLYVATCDRLFSLQPGERVLSELAQFDETISALYVSEDNQSVWLGTQRSGVVRYDRTNGHSEVFADILKYDKPVVYSMTMDAEKNLWMGTTRGVIRYSTLTRRISLYDETDGVVSATCFPRSVYMNEQGSVFFGGNDGFTVFCPSKITANPYAPTLLLSTKPSASLAYNDNNVVFELASTSYWKSAKNRYRYRLLGLQNQWVEVSSHQRVVRYDNLPSGHYVFEACASNNDGVWGPVSRYSFQIRSAWWNSWWAWGIYILLIGGVLAYMVYTLLHHRQMKNELYKASVQHQEEEKANRAKVRFFADVNKEIRGPLLQLQSMVDIHHVPYIQQMLDTMAKYTDKYCIDTGKNPKEYKIDQDLRKFTDLIDARLANHIDIDELAREMGMSRRKLFGFIKDNTGKSIIEYIRSYRISTAAKLLAEQNLTMLDVMDRVGFDSQSYFIKTFRQEYGVTPSEFIAQMNDKNRKV